MCIRDSAARLPRPQQRSAACASTSSISTLQAARSRCLNRCRKRRSSTACQSIPTPSNNERTTSFFP
eukprot:11857403-Alexandrium_andersonii.AAC.1